MDVILFGIVMDVKPLQFLKADSLMDVTPLPMFNDVKPLQSLYLQTALFQLFTC